MHSEKFLEKIELVCKENNLLLLSNHPKKYLHMKIGGEEELNPA